MMKKEICLVGQTKNQQLLLVYFYGTHPARYVVMVIAFCVCILSLVPPSTWLTGRGTHPASR